MSFGVVLNLTCLIMMLKSPMIVICVVPSSLRRLVEAFSCLSHFFDSHLFHFTKVPCPNLACLLFSPFSIFLTKCRVPSWYLFVKFPFSRALCASQILCLDLISLLHLEYFRDYCHAHAGRPV